MTVFLPAAPLNNQKSQILPLQNQNLITSGLLTVHYWHPQLSPRFQAQWVRVSNTISPLVCPATPSTDDSQPGTLLMMDFTRFSLTPTSPTPNEKSHFFSSSESEEEDDHRKKFKIQIKPLLADSSDFVAPSVDQLKASIGNITLSPSPMVSPVCGNCEIWRLHLSPLCCTSSRHQETFSYYHTFKYKISTSHH